MILNPGGQAEDKETGQKGGREYSFKKLCFIVCCFDFVIFIRFYLFIFREGEGGRKKGKYERVVVSGAPPPGGLACNPATCPDWKWNL